MSDINQDQLADLVLHQVVQHYNQSDRDLGASELASRLPVQASKTRVELVLRELEGMEYVHGSYNVYEPTVWSLQPKGYRYVEEQLARPESFLANFQNGGSSALQTPQSVLTDPTLSNEDRIEKLETILAPAAGRMVPLNHNSETYQRAVSDLEVAVEAIGASNLLDPSIKNESLPALRKGQELLASKASLSIGMIKSFTVDRLKSVANSSIEDFIKQAILMAILSLGALLVSIF